MQEPKRKIYCGKKKVSRETKRNYKKFQKGREKRENQTIRYFIWIVKKRTGKRLRKNNQYKKELINQVY